MMPNVFPKSGMLWWSYINYLNSFTSFTQESLSPRAASWPDFQYRHAVCEIRSDTGAESCVQNTVVAINTVRRGC